MIGCHGIERSSFEERQIEISMASVIGGGLALASFSIRLIGGETAQRFFDAALDATLFRSVAHRVRAPECYVAATRPPSPSSLACLPTLTEHPSGDDSSRDQR